MSAKGMSLRLAATGAPVAAGSLFGWRGVAVATMVTLVLAPGGVEADAARIGIAAVLVGGVVSGLLAGLLGIGGALVTVPMLWFALPRLGVGDATLPHAVVASSLVAMLPTGLAAAWANHRLAQIDAAWLGRMAPVMLLGAAAGALAASHLRGTALILAFAAQSLYYGSRMLVFGNGVSPGRATAVGPFARASARLPYPVAGTGMAGFCACVGMGGGSMVVPYLLSRGLPLRQTVATGGALNLFIAAGGIVGVLGSGAGDVRPAWGAALLLGAVAAVAAPVGTRLASRLPVPRLALGVGLVNVAGAAALLGQAL
jgi:uncharacterized membrane protein YfcA